MSTGYWRPPRNGGAIMVDVMIHISDAVVSYREDVALQGVSLDVRTGEFVGVIGPNGAGKTTLLTLINGLGRLAHGHVSVMGLQPKRSAGHQLRRSIGYVAQAEHVDARLPITVRETVMVGVYGVLGWFRRPARAHWQKVDRALEQVGVAHLADRPLGHLSGGEYQRTAIARALVQEPEIFLFDEPTASIDPRAQQDILNLIQVLHAQNGLTTLYVTHDLKTLPEACERLVLMKGGRLWREGPRDAMLAPGLLAELYEGNGVEVKPQ